MFFFFNDTATTEIYTLSLHDALPICIKIPDHLTLEALEALQVCARLFSIVPHSSLRSLPSEIVAKVQSLEPHYVPDRKSTRLNSSHANISYAVFCLKKKKNYNTQNLK